MVKLPIIAVKDQIYKAGTPDESKYQILTLLLEDGDTAKVNSYLEKPAKAGQVAILGLQVDRRTGAFVVRLKDIA